jgi:stearoyl-CoA desaturase (delta-9 desaturase)
MSIVTEPWTGADFATSHAPPTEDQVVARDFQIEVTNRPNHKGRKGHSPRNPKPAAAPTAKPLFKARPAAIGINWPIAGWLLLLHVGALAAPFTFTWQGLVLMFVLHWITGGLGVCLGYHRLLTHGSFRTFRPVRWLLGVLGVLSGEGSAVDWVANHRKHHALSDKEGDPHSPRDGAWWSHVFWIVPQMADADYHAHVRRWSPDVARDRGLLWIGRFQLPLHFVLGIGLLAVGWAFGGWSLGVSLMVWGLFVRLVFVLHSTWLVNSASHMWGYRNYESGDDSRNNWLVALFTYGEGWHNNHHAYPRMAQHGHRWWEIDLTFRVIRLLQRVGLVWDVVDYKHKHHAD